MNLVQRKYSIRDIIALPLKCAPGAAVLIFLHAVLSGGLATLQIVVISQFIDTAIEIVRDGLAVRLIYPALFSLAGIIAFMWVSQEIIKFAYVRLELALRAKFRTAVIEKRAKLAYHHIENHETWNLISRISDNPEMRLKDAYSNLLGIISIIVQIGGVLSLLLIHVWWAALLIIGLSVPMLMIAMKSGKATYEANRDVSKYKRRVEYLTDVLTNREHVDERYLFGYGDDLNEDWHNQYETARKVEFHTERKWYIKMKLSGIISSLISMMIVFVLLGPVLAGAITVGVFVALVQAAFNIAGNMSWRMMRHIDELAKTAEWMKDLTQFVALEETRGATALPASPPPKFETLEFRRVRFKYPGTSKYILQDLSLQIQAGRHYAFVGVNGAGKTTITKLMTGLYDIEEGEILLNGRSLSEYSQSELKAFYSIVYQDFAKYYIAMEDNIAVGDMNRFASGQSMTGSIDGAIRHVGLQDVENKLPLGRRTPLGKIKDQGLDLSGGEWQRLAMARAIINPAPVRLLDEPTAALDPISESKLYRDFEKISSGMTTILISHRLGSTKLADHIFVIGDGCVLEQGSHHDLMKMQGIYAEMYVSQRSWYYDEAAQS